MADEETKETTSEHGNEEKSATDGQEKTPEDKKKQYFTEELKRLQNGLKQDKDKIKKPAYKEHTPYIFSPPDPYCSTHTAKYLIEGPEDKLLIPRGYKMRQTAIGLVDPELDHQMDVKLLPTHVPKEVKSLDEINNRRKKGEKEQNPLAKEGSTRLPKYPAVKNHSQDIAIKKLNYYDIPMLREELKKKYTGVSEEKINEDYNRTKADFYRMELDKLDEVHPLNQENFRKTYFAYLQNTPGSKKAVKECVKELDEKMKSAENTPRSEKGDTQSEKGYDDDKGAEEKQDMDDKEGEPEQEKTDEEKQEEGTY